jgi:hypothetical protein
MGLPKNFHKTTNLNKRVEALNNLTFYNFDYSVKLTNNTYNDIKDNNKSYDELNQILGEITDVNNKTIQCSNRISSLDLDKAEEKINEWLTRYIDMGIIEEYRINEVTIRTFKEELEHKSLNNLL